MQHSETTTALMAAIVKAQSEMQGAVKGSENPFFRSKYADLSSVMAASKEALHSHDLAIVQFPIASDGMCGVETVIVHGSGEWMSQACLLATSKQDPQAYGSAITYARRYGWQSVCGIPSEDDDGNYATHGSSKPKKPQPQPVHDEYKAKAEALLDKYSGQIAEDKKYSEWVDACVADGYWKDLHNNMAQRFDK